MTEDERQWGMYGHLSGLLACTGIPFGGVIGPLVIYLQNKTTRPHATAQARNALNFHATITLFQFICIAVAIVGWVIMLAHAMSDVPEKPALETFVTFAIGMGGYALLYLWSFVWTIVNTVRSSSGNLVSYPLTIPFFS